MGVTFIAPQGTYTAPAKLVTKEITENGTYDATDDSANGYSSVTVNVEGGGGSSDFSTAEVTLINTSSNYPYTIGLVNIADDNIQMDNIEVLESQVVIVPLYKGKTVVPWYVRNARINSWVGSDNVIVEYNPILQTGSITITGNGTFTATGNSTE